MLLSYDGEVAKFVELSYFSIITQQRSIFCYEIICCGFLATKYAQEIIIIDKKNMTFLRENTWEFRLLERKYTRFFGKGRWLCVV